jgi:pimeloyl-ACP methyl ester carboxylesterase
MTTPTLFLAGSETDRQQKEGTERLRAALPNAELRILEGHGHPGILTGPELVAEEVKAFTLKT